MSPDRVAARATGVPLARRSLAARPGRSLWLVAAVAVAVAVTVGAIGFSAGLTRLLDPATTGTDLGLLPAGTVVVTPRTGGVTSATALDDALLAQVRGVPGVAVAEGSYDQPVAFRLRPGEQSERPVILRGVVLSSTYAPQRWAVVSGRAPRGPDEVAVDGAGLVVGRTAVGARVTLELPTGARDVTVVGLLAPAAPDGATATPASPATPAGADPRAVALASAHAILDAQVAPVLLDAVGQVDRITVGPLPGTDPADLARRLTERLPDGVRVTASRNRAAVTQHTVEAIDGGVRRAVQAVAALSVLISSLVVANTFGVIVAQRTRELGLLRLVGATRRRVVGSLLAETALVGVAGAALGLVVGVVLAVVAGRFVQTTTVPVRSAWTPVMVPAALGVGVGVTTVGGLLPAWRAGRVPPMAALSDARAGGERRAGLGGPLAALSVGAATIAVALAVVRPAGAATAVVTSVAAAGAVVAFVGVAGVSRWVAAPLLGLVGAAVHAGGRAVGASVRLGVGNARRSPARTAGAASTLLVGLALVAVVGTVGASVRATVADRFASASRADLYLERRGVVRVSTGSLIEHLGRRLGRRRVRVQGWAAISSVDGALVTPGGTVDEVTATPMALLASVVDLGVADGRLPTSPAPGMRAALSVRTADRLGVAVGDRVTLRSTSGVDVAVTVVATYARTAIVGDAVVDETNLDPAMLGTFELGLLRTDDPRARDLVTRSAGHFPKVRVHTPEEFDRLDTAVTDTVLRILAVVLVGMAGIGELGLVATLGLATSERRRELVMLRAVGATRRQVSRSVMVEAALVALVGAVVGLGSGTVVGVVAASAASDDLVAAVVVPWPLLAVAAGASVAVAVAVSSGVARSAGRLPPAEAGRTL